MSNWPPQQDSPATRLTWLWMPDAPRRSPSDLCTPEEYNEMYRDQGGQCAGCRLACDVLHIDHDHETGRVRGLLCRDCNLALGFLHDDKDCLHRLIFYLELAEAKGERFKSLGAPESELAA